jgi:hypothetical protein
MPSISLSELQSSIYTRLDNNTNLYLAAELTSAINESIRSANLFTGYIQGTSSISSVTNQVWYTVPNGVLVPLRLTFAGPFLEKTSLEKLSNYNPNWQLDTTRNTGIPVVQWVTSGLWNFAIHPADSIGSNTMLLTSVLEPTLLVDSGDTIQVPNEYAEAIEELSVVALVLKEGGKSFADILMLRQKAMDTLKKFRRWQTERQPGQNAEMVSTR